MSKGNVRRGGNPAGARCWFSWSCQPVPLQDHGMRSMHVVAAFCLVAGGAFTFVGAASAQLPAGDPAGGAPAGAGMVRQLPRDRAQAAASTRQCSPELERCRSHAVDDVYGAARFSADPSPSNARLEAHPHAD
jgi:hypothetical protein